MLIFKKFSKTRNSPRIEMKYHPNGEIKSKATYENGKKHGVMTEWTADGTKYRVTMWRDSKMHGMETEWTEGGTKWRKVMWVNGKKHGLVTKWYGDGEKWTEAMWRKGKKHGTETEWLNNGKKEWSRMWNNGKQHGLEVCWYHGIDPEEWQTYYRHGKIYGEIQYNRKRKVIKVSFPNAEISSISKSTKSYQQASKSAHP